MLPQPFIYKGLLISNTTKCPFRAHEDYLQKTLGAFRKRSGCHEQNQIN